MTIPQKLPAEDIPPVPHYIHRRRVASLNWICGPEKFDVYARSFHKAAKALFEKYKTDTQVMLDTDICPIITLYRQALELYLKGILITGGQIMRAHSKTFPEGENEFIFKNHGLCRLLDPVRKTFTEVGWVSNHTGTAGLETLDKLESYINKMEKIDPTSHNFRYPLKKDGKPSVQPNFSVDVFDLATKMDLVLDFLDQADCGLSAYYDELQSQADYGEQD